LPQLWDAQWQEDEALQLCQSMIGLRMSSWGVEKVFAALGLTMPKPLADAIVEFDHELHNQGEILATVVGTLWWKELRQACVNADEAWWLNENLSSISAMMVSEAAATIPSQSEWATIRARALWNEACPSLTGSLAAKKEIALQVREICWVSSEGENEFVAHLMIPSHITTQELSAPRRLYVTRSRDGASASELTGRAIRLGAFNSTLDDTGSVFVRLSELGDDFDGQLYVGESKASWRIEIDKD
jgi:hypothetical protein